MLIPHSKMNGSTPHAFRISILILVFGFGIAIGHIISGRLMRRSHKSTGSVSSVSLSSDSEAVDSHHSIRHTGSAPARLRNHSDQKGVVLPVAILESARVEFVDIQGNLNPNLCQWLGISEESQQIIQGAVTAAISEFKAIQRDIAAQEYYEDGNLRSFTLPPCAEEGGVVKERLYESFANALDSQIVGILSKKLKTLEEDLLQDSGSSEVKFVFEKAVNEYGGSFELNEYRNGAQVAVIPLSKEPGARAQFRIPEHLSQYFYLVDEGVSLRQDFLNP